MTNNRIFRIIFGLLFLAMAVSASITVCGRARNVDRCRTRNLSFRWWRRR